jgi:hypothetical protein
MVGSLTASLVIIRLLLALFIKVVKAQDFGEE